jgi:hypothetical protein
MAQNGSKWPFLGAHPPEGDRGKPQGCAMQVHMWQKCVVGGYPQHNREEVVRAGPAAHTHPGERSRQWFGYLTAQGLLPKE